MLQRLRERKAELVSMRDETMQQINQLQHMVSALNGGIAELDNLLEELEGAAQVAPLETIEGQGQHG